MYNVVKTVEKDGRRVGFASRDRDAATDRHIKQLTERCKIHLYR